MSVSKVYIGNLAEDVRYMKLSAIWLVNSCSCRDRDIEKLFKGYGRVRNIVIKVRETREYDVLEVMKIDKCESTLVIALCVIILINVDPYASILILNLFIMVNIYQDDNA